MHCERHFLKFVSLSIFAVITDKSCVCLSVCCLNIAVITSSKSVMGRYLLFISYIGTGFRYGPVSYTHLTLPTILRV